MRLELAKGVIIILASVILGKVGPAHALPCWRVDPPPPDCSGPPEPETRDVSRETSMVPKYAVIAIKYAPPGTAGPSPSQVVYTQASTRGSQMSISDTFKQTTAGGGEVKVKFFSININDTSTVQAVQNTSQITYKDSVVFEDYIVGPRVNGLSHDNDVFVIAFRPTISISQSWTERQSRSGQWTKIQSTEMWTWSMRPSGQIQEVSVKALMNPNDPQAMDEGTKIALENANVDYGAVLAMHPLLGGAKPKNNPRFIPANASLNYSSTAGQGQQSYTISSENATTTTAGGSTGGVTTLKVGFDEKAADWLNVSLTYQDTMEWTHSSTGSSTSTYSSAVRATIYPPTQEYTGLETRAVAYWDTIFHTMAWNLETVDPSRLTSSGVVRDGDGKGVANALVTMSVEGQRFVTATDAIGGFSFYDTPNGEATLYSQGATKTIPVPAPSKRREPAELVIRR